MKVTDGEGEVEGEGEGEAISPQFWMALIPLSKDRGAWLARPHLEPSNGPVLQVSGLREVGCTNVQKTT